MTATPDRGMRRIVVGLALSAVALAVAGGLADWLWLMGIGAWALIAAFLIELIYRP
ncbi:hypothetical protein [Streptomyces agglomeratus]|uniref:hypothetical protein n=1 Tax=Streptomyces agglomeratus TaxID=285458 RepID=UPI0014289F83|nr:hypothetical protein [Streptomyces agglomeratus]